MYSVVMKTTDKKKTSKFLSLVLRHNPAAAGLTLDNEGWADVNALMPVLRQRGLAKTIMELEEIVRDNDKQRFTLSDDKRKIRANQGHSLEVNLGLTPQAPPDVLYHGTVPKFLDAIFESGIKHMSRQHVHLSEDVRTANKVGQRRGKPIILRIDSKRMAEAGYEFYLSANGVWLVDHVPSGFVSIEGDHGSV